MSDVETVNVYNEKAEAYAELNMDEYAQAALAAFMARLPPQTHVLDLGCGPGQAAATLQKNGFTVDAIDASEEMVKMARDKFGVDARLATFEDITSTDAYSGVWAAFSLLHASQESFPHILTNLHRAISNDGFFCLSMKTGNNEKRDKLGRLYSYYSEEELLQHLQTAGFTILEKVHGEGPGLAGNVEPWLTVHCSV